MGTKRAVIVIDEDGSSVTATTIYWAWTTSRWTT
jgi:hypothetical protein